MIADSHLPVQLTSFVGRTAELAELHRLASEHRLVTLTGPGGVGKTRLALRLAEEIADEFPDGTRWVDLATLTDPDLVADRLAHTLELPDQPGQTAAEALVGFAKDRQLLLVLDNCEHLLGGCATLIATLLSTCQRLQILATSREPIGVPGELTWLTPSLSPADEAIELFTARGRLTRPDFAGTGTDDSAAVAEICRRLDGIPLAIELAATRVRALSLTEITDGLRDRLDLLTSTVRTAESRQQTLRASIDWSHDLLLEPKRVLFRRLSVFAGGFDLDAARAVAGDDDAQDDAARDDDHDLSRHQVVDYLTQLVDKSLIVADNTRASTRYRMLESIRQYAREKLEDSGEVRTIQLRHRDYYTNLFGTRTTTGHQWHIEHADIELDNLRAVFTWSRQHGELDLAAQLTSALLPLWIHSHTLEGLSWFDTVLTTGSLTPAVHTRALADKAVLSAFIGDYRHVGQAEEAVAIAREINDPALLAWALAACGIASCYRPELALPYFEQALELSSALDDDWQLSQIYGVQAFSAYLVGDLATTLAAAGEGYRLADAIGDWSTRRVCRHCIGLAQLLRGDPAGAAAQANEVALESETAQDPLFTAESLMLLAEALSHRGDPAGARAAAAASAETAANLVAFHHAISLGALADASLAAGDVPAALAAGEAMRKVCALPRILVINGNPLARVALASGDASAARQQVDETLAAAFGAHRILLLEILVRTAIAEDAAEHAEQHAQAALAIAVETESFLAVPNLIESLATLATNSGNNHEAAKLFGSAAGLRDRTGIVRFKVYDADYRAAVDTVQKAMTPKDFEGQWAEGAGLSMTEAIANARRSGAVRDRPAGGWASLTPAQVNVAALVTEGLRDKEIAEKLFVSTRTVHAHLTQIYAKLGISSRVQLAKEAARHG